MKTQLNGWACLFLVLVLPMMAGCMHVAMESTPGLFAVRFRDDFLDHSKDEMISSVTLTACPASVYRIDKLPYDWDASASIPDSFEVTCTLSSGHASSATWDIEDLNDVVYLRVDPEYEKDLKLSAEFYITEGRFGDSRTVSLDRDQIILKRMGTAPDWP